MNYWSCSYWLVAEGCGSGSLLPLATGTRSVGTGVEFPLLLPLQVRLHNKPRSASQRLYRLAHLHLCTPLPQPSLTCKASEDERSVAQGASLGWKEEFLLTVIRWLQRAMICTFEACHAEAWSLWSGSVSELTRDVYRVCHDQAASAAIFSPLFRLRGPRRCVRD